VRVNREKTLCRDKFGTKIIIFRNQEGGYDLLTDGRVFLSASLARELAAKLLKFTAENAPGS
jgi:hypothetical protein